MLNIFLRDDSSIVERSKTIIAKNGYIIKRNEKNILVLYNGTIQTEKKNNKINFINFNRTEINLSSFSTKTTTYPKIQENDTLSLLNCIKPFLDESKTIIKKFQCRARIDDIISELNRRLMMPFYIPFISIIICYLLSSGKESKYYLLKKYIVFIVAFSVLVFAEIMVRYSGQSILYSAAYYLLPPSLILLNYLYLTKIFKYENLGK